MKDLLRWMPSRLRAMSSNNTPGWRQIGVFFAALNALCAGWFLANRKIVGPALSLAVVAFVMRQMFLRDRADDDARMTELNRLVYENTIRRHRIDGLREALKDFVDPNPCWYDHHGKCQEHGSSSHGHPCRNAVARDELARYDGPALRKEEM